MARFDDCYKITKSKNTYFFTTDSGYKFKIEIDNVTGDAPFECEGNIYFFVFTSNKPKGKKDPKIANTIIKFLLDNVTIETDAIIVIYDYRDMGDKKRQETFKEWFDGSEIEGLEMHDGSIKLPENRIGITGLLIHSENPNKKDIVEYFQDF